MSVLGVEFDRTLVLLNDENRFVRKKALNDIGSYLSTKSGYPNYVYNERSLLPLTELAQSLSSTLNDNIEVNRELAVKINHMLLDLTPDICNVASSLIPVLVKRLGQKEVVEPSEELRLDTLRLVQVMSEKMSDITPFVDELLTIIQHSLMDSYHEVKKLSCNIAQELAQKGGERFYRTSECLINPLLANLIHQHSKVRVAAIQAIGTVLIHSQSKLVDQTILPLTQRLFDSACAVRRSVVEVVGSWLLDLPDRYSYHTSLLPLILTGMLDDSVEVRELTESLWHDIGLKFEKENEEQLKDKLDFQTGPPYYYPLGCLQPIFGCRELVYRSASRLLPALCRDLGDWQASTRSKASGLIPILILHLEHLVSQHTQHLLTGLGSGLTDAIGRIAPSTSSVSLLRLVPAVAFRDQPIPATNWSVNQHGPESMLPRLPRLLATGSTDVTESLLVTHQLLLSAQLLGAFVESKLWWPLLKSALNRCTESAAPTSLAGHLFLLAGFLSGAPADQLSVTLSDSIVSKPATESVKTVESADVPVQQLTVLHHIVHYLATDDLMSVISFGSKAALLECVLVVIRRLEESIIILRTPDNNSLTPEEQRHMTSCSSLLADFKLRSLLFQLLLALGAVWADGDCSTTDFGTAFLELTDQLMRQLAACERDYALLSHEPRNSLDAGHRINESHSGQTSMRIHLLDMASPTDVDRLYSRHLRQLFQRLESSQTEAGSWHARSVGLAIFSRCLQTAGPALLMDSTQLPPSSDAHIGDRTCLPIVLRLLEHGCRLNRTPGVDSEKSPGGSDPLTIASEAELRLRGLILITRLTDNGPVRTALSSPTYLGHCLTRLVLPACVWRAGRTAEAMRKAAVTCLVALLAAATDTYDIDEANVDSRSMDEIRLDVWLCEHVSGVHRLLGEKTVTEDKNRLLRSDEEHMLFRRSSLVNLPASLLSLLLTRLGGLLEDDLEATRKMTCLSLTLLFNGLLLPSAADSTGALSDAPTFLFSSKWLAPEASPDVIPLPRCPLPNSFGDQVYRFYPNLIKRLNDGKDQIRLLVTETLNAWLRLVHPMLVCCDPHEQSAPESQRLQVNPVHSFVVEDFIGGLMPHLDDQNEQVRAAVARVMARVGHFASDLARAALQSAVGRHRASQLCSQLLDSIQLCE